MLTINSNYYCKNYYKNISFMLLYNIHLNIIVINKIKLHISTNVIFILFIVELSVTIYINFICSHKIDRKLKI